MIADSDARLMVAIAIASYVMGSLCFGTVFCCLEMFGQTPGTHIQTGCVCAKALKVAVLWPFYAYLGAVWFFVKLLQADH